MAQHAILHTGTRVIRRLTTEDVPGVTADETAVLMAAPVSLAGGPYKLHANNTTLLSPSVTELRNAGMDAAFEASEATRRRVELRDALVAVRDNVGLHADLRTLAQKLLQFLRAA